MNNTGPEKQSGFYLLSDNSDAFIARFALATMAKKTLDIQYYIIHSDASGQYLGHAILSAADRGVYVRILVDDINLAGRDSRLKMLSQHKNIKIRIFNPLRQRDWFRNIELIINIKRAGRRMHNKAFIADSEAAIIGGRNIGDEYFDARNDVNFVDLDLLTIGPIVRDISGSFNIFWNSHWATAIEDISKVRILGTQLKTFHRKLRDKWLHAKNTAYFHSMQQAELTQKIISRSIPFVYAEAKLFYDQPEKICKDKIEKTTHIGPQILPYFNQTKKQLFIATPYFIPGSSGVTWLKKMHQQGVDIHILTNSLAATDVIAVHAGYRKYRSPLLRYGIKLYELKPGANLFRQKAKRWLKGFSSASLHAKYMVIDQQYVLIGSANLDPRSERLNTEIGIMVNSKKLADQTIKLFELTTSTENSYHLSLKPDMKHLLWTGRKQGKTKSYNQEPEAGLFRRILVRLIALLPVENLL